jgi:hypothetical protein
MLIVENTTPDQSAPESTSFQYFMEQQLRLGTILGKSNLTLSSMVKSSSDLVKVLNVIPGIDATKFTGPLKEGIDTIMDVAIGLGKEFLQVEETAMKTFDTFGVGSGNVEMLKSRLYEAGLEMVKFSKGGLDSLEAFEKAQKMQAAYNSELRRNNFLALDTIVDIQAASELTNVSTDNLIKGFAGVGRNLDNVGENMETVAKTITNMGVNVAGVSDNVVKYMGKLDLYNFKGGIEGLARMTAESAKLGINMESIFAKTTELLDPDKAIDFANSLSQLGFAASELSDPIRVMFLAENDPEEFAKEIGKLTESMFKFNEETGEVDFLKGNRRMLLELKNITGQSEEELMKQGKRMKEFAMISEELKFTPYSEEDKKLIEGLAQYKKGEGFVIEFTDREGKQQKKNIVELSSEDREDLKDEMTIKNTQDALKKQLSTNELGNTILFGIQGILLQSLVLQKGIGAGAKKVREMGYEGGDIDVFKNALAETKTVSNIVKAETMAELQEAFGDITKDIKGLIPTDKSAASTGAAAEDFIYRSDGSILRFDEGDLVMGIKESFLKGTPTNMSSSNDMEDRFASLRDKVNPEVKIPISGEITLNLNVTSDKDISKEKLEGMLFEATTLQNLKSKINEAVSNFNLTA